MCSNTASTHQKHPAAKTAVRVSPGLALGRSILGWGRSAVACADCAQPAKRSTSEIAKVFTLSTMRDSRRRYTVGQATRGRSVGRARSAFGVAPAQGRYRVAFKGL